MVERPDPPGVFIDPSEFRRMNFNFDDRRFAALRDLATEGRVCLLSTDVAISEIRKLIQRQISTAHQVLTSAKISILKSLNTEWANFIRKLPSESDLATDLTGQFDKFLSSTSCVILNVAEVDPAEIFDDYFAERPPFDDPKKRKEFPDAFTLRRLVGWSGENRSVVFVIGPDGDLKRFCESNNNLVYFEKTEAFLGYINQEDSLVEVMDKLSDEVKEKIKSFCKEAFDELGFVLRFHDHGSVDSVSVETVEVTNLYALKIVNGTLLGEADVNVDYSASFSYDDLDTASYDKEADEWIVFDTVEGAVNQRASLSVGFVLTIDADGGVEVYDLEFVEDTVSVKEEDRGDYDAYK